MKVIAITGRSGSGKSTVSAYYGSLGYPVLDADRTAREVTRPGGPCLAQLCDAFGSDILLPDGTLDRGCLAARAFATPEGTRRLTDITHPAIIRELLDSVAAAQSTGVRSCLWTVRSSWERHSSNTAMRSSSLPRPSGKLFPASCCGTAFPSRRRVCALRHRRRRTYCVLRQIIS